MLVELTEEELKIIKKVLSEDAMHDRAMGRVDTAYRVANGDRKAGDPTRKGYVDCIGDWNDESPIEHTAEIDNDRFWTIVLGSFREMYEADGKNIDAEICGGDENDIDDETVDNFCDLWKETVIRHLRPKIKEEWDDPKETAEKFYDEILDVFNMLLKEE